ncbi:MAG: hypothetical protein QOJ67_2156 [Acidimicrobiaceae bacterium]|jgi:hypothetical protein
MLTLMKKLIASISIAAALGGGAFALNTALPAGAQSNPTTESPSSPAATKPDGAAHAGRHPRRARVIRGAVKVSADTIGIPQADLVSALKDGQSIAQVAEAHGVTTQTVIDALVNAGSAKADEAVANGKVTQAQADKIKARLPQAAERIVNHTK